MQEIFVIIICICVLSCFSIYTLVRYFQTKQSKFLIEFGVGVLCSMILGGVLAYKIVSKTIEKADQLFSFKERSGMEIYRTLLDEPLCEVKVSQHLDQVIPKVDTHISLFFSTCPQEIKRLLAKENYKQSLYDSTTVASYDPSWSKAIKALKNPKRFEREFDGKRGMILVISEDSTQAYYCDIAD